MGKIKSFITSFLQKNYDHKTVQINSETVDNYLSFYRQQAYEMKKHLTYEHDMAGTLNGGDSVIVKFNIQTYINRFDKYFIEKRIYKSSLHKNYYKLLIVTLIPEKSISDLIPINVRKKLFIGLINKTIEKNRINKKIFIKYLWEYINSLENPFNGEYPDKILEIFKEAIAEQDKKNLKEVSSPVINNFLKLEILSEVLLINRIHSQKDMKSLLRASSFAGFVFKLIILIIIPVISYVVLYSLLGSGAIENFQLKDIIQVLIIGISIWLFLFFSVLLVFIYTQTRRKTLFRSILAIARTLHIKQEVLMEFFRNKYSIDYRKIR